VNASSELVTSVPLLDLKAQYHTIRDEVKAAIDDVCESQYFVMGPMVSQFEKEAASYSNVAHAIGVSSGSDALLVALMALDIGAGDEVITSPFTFFATGGAIARLGATPVFCDIDEHTYNLDAASVSAFIAEHCVVDNGVLRNKRTDRIVKAVIPVHLFGQTADMQALMDIARDNHLYVVEDAAQAIGAETVDGQRAGSVGDIGCFSFFPSKNLGAFGDGGMCVTQNDELAEKLRVLRVHGGKPKYYHALIGGNFRLDALQAAILSVKLKHLDSWTAGRQANADRYDELLAARCPSINAPLRLSGGRHIFNQYTIRVSDRDGLRQHLNDKTIGSEVYYPVPLHLQQCFTDLGYRQGDFPVSEEAAASVISLPVYPELSAAQLRYVVDNVADFVG
jgi:dTDP-4-amino-4,6-dideoxygalactose transaminase